MDVEHWHGTSMNVMHMDLADGASRNGKERTSEGESGWSSFAKRGEVMVHWLHMIVYEEIMVSNVGSACLREIGYKSRWWANTTICMGNLV